jgi:shikimate kinase
MHHAHVAKINVGNPLLLFNISSVTQIIMGRLVNLFLIGPMGAGKSTIGKQIARELRLDFFDADQEIELRTGADIAWIFDVEGEAGFRVREQSVIDDLSQKQGIILATGGGAILSAANRKNLASRGTVVYLYATVEQQVKRTARDRRRPLVNHDIPEDTLLDLMAFRDPLYREISDIVVTTDGKSVRTVAQEVIDLLEQENLR